jgi:putative membrane protein (TIGR04086 family)
MNVMNKSSLLRISSPILSGLIYASLCTAFGTFVIALLLFASGMKEESLPLYTYILHAVALLIGGYVSGKRSAQKGWYHGGMVGIIYALIVLIVGFLGFDQSITLQSLILFAASFLISALGGMFGVNTKH